MIHSSQKLQTLDLAKAKFCPLVLACCLAVAAAAHAQVTATWNSTTGNWSDATRWSTDPLFPNNGNGGNDYNAVINGGTVTLDQDITIEDFTLTGGSLTASSPVELTVNDLMTWTNGTVSGSGETTIAASGSLAISGTAVGVIRTLGRTLINGGTANWTGNRGLTFSGGTFENNNSFTVNSSSLLDAGGTGVFNNAGTFTKQGTGTTQFTVGVVFNNSGLVDLQAGSLRLDAGGTHTGDFAIAANTTLTLTGTQAFEGSNAISGPGTLTISTGTTSFNGTTTVGGALNLASSTATLSGTGTISVDGASTWTNGTMSGTGQTTITSTGSLAISGTTVGLNRQLNRTLVNEGTVNWTGSRPITMNNGTFQNNGTFTVNSSSLLDAAGSGGTNAFDNSGTFTKQGSGTTQFTTGLVFNNSGTVDVQLGTLRLDAGGTHTGDFSLAIGTTLALTSTHNFEGTTAISGPGTLSISTGTTSFNGITTVDGALNMASSTATLSGTGSVSFAGSSTWTNGTMAGAGQTSIASGGSLAISGGGVSIHQIDRQLTIDGTAIWSGATPLTMNGGTIENNGGFTANATAVQDAFGTGGINAFNNSGTFTKLGASTTQFRTGLAFNNSGTVDIQAGPLRFDAGGTHSGNFAVPTGTSLTFSGTHTFIATSSITGTGTFSNVGTVDVQGGTLTVQPTVTQLSGTQLMASTWKIQNNSTLDITSGSNITTSFANVTIDGASSSFPKINTLVDNRGSFAVLGGHEFTAAGAFSNQGTVTIGVGSTLTAANGFSQTSSGTLRGSGTLLGNVQNSGSLRPGSSPGIITIDGDLTQSAGSILEIEVGGYSPGTEHDQVQVTGTATLGGRLEVPILQPFNPVGGPFPPPMPGQIIQFLTAGTRTGVFTAVVSPNLDDLYPGLAIDIAYQADGAQMSFVEQKANIILDETSGSNPDWFSLNTWENTEDPMTDLFPLLVNDLTLSTSVSGSPEVSVGVDNALVAKLTVGGSGSQPLSIRVGNGNAADSVGNLSSTTGVTISQNGAISLDEDTLASSAVTLDGGTLNGNGLIDLDANTSLGPGTLTVASGTISPGFSVGQLEVDGDLQLSENATVVIEIEGVTSFDEIDVSGEATLGGSLTVMVPDDGSVEAGDVFAAITAGDTMGTEFDDVLTIGTDELFAIPVYSPDEVALVLSDVGDLDQQVDGVTLDDVDDFAMALSNPDLYDDEHDVDHIEAGDMDGDNDCDVDDIDNFAEKLGMSVVELSDRIRAYSTNVPEPSTLLLAMLGAAVPITRCRCRKHDLSNAA